MACAEPVVLLDAVSPADPTGTASIRRSWAAAARLRLRQVRAALRVAVMETDILGLTAASPLAIHSGDVRQGVWHNVLQHALRRSLQGDWSLPYVRRAWAKGETDADSTPGTLSSAHIETLLNHELDGIIAAIVAALARMGFRHFANRAQAWAAIAAVFDAEVVKRLPALVSVMTVTSYNRAKVETYRSRGVERVGIVPEQRPEPSAGFQLSPLNRAALAVGAVVGAHALARELRPSRWVKNEQTGAWEFKRGRRAERALRQAFPEGQPVAVQTAEDDRVCDACDGIADGSPYSLDAAMDLLPVHIGCRCAIVEWTDADAAVTDFVPPHIHDAAVQPVYDFAVARWAEELHPRIPKGEAGGGQFALGEGGEPLQMDPRATDVGGDSYNKGKAQQLEYEYERVKPELEALAEKITASGGYVEVETGEEEEYESTPEEWDALSNSVQTETEEKWYSESHDEFHESEVNNWVENGGQLADSKSDLAYKESKNDEIPEWMDEALEDLRDAREEAGQPDYPFDNATLRKAMGLDYTNYVGDGTDDPKFKWNDDELQHPEGWIDNPSLPIPGMEQEQPSARLTPAMRKDIEAGVKDAFNKAADENADKIDPPEYLDDSIKELQGEYWGQKDDDEKFKLAKTYGLVETTTETTGEGGTETRQLVRPHHFDPLGAEPTSKDYKDTQAFARRLSVQRAADVIAQRGVAADRDSAERVAQALDNRLWASWKGSSTSADGQLLQLAAAREFGGRLNEQQIELLHEFKPSEVNQAQAYLRGKWETTQYLLDKADLPMLDLYRGLRIDASKEKQVGVFLPDGKPATMLPNTYFNRNGAASFTADRAIANNWGPVVLRLQAPRTAVLSVPAYGQNVYNEKETVVMGTAWNGWDAWKTPAPPISSYPVQHQ
jgi:hypothetical protein